MNAPQQPPVLAIQMVPAGVEMVLRGLNKLPREESDALYNEIAGQANYQIQELVKQAQEKEAAEKAAAEAQAKAAAAAEKAAKKAAKGKDAPANDAPPADDPLA